VYPGQIDEGCTLAMARTRLSRMNTSQAPRLSEEVAFAASVTELVVRRDGDRCVIRAADSAWDDFFAAPGIDLGDLPQLEAPSRGRL
jgi:antitoxin VapB